ncbi:MazG-like pyrophosphatase [Staphylococcus phage S-CoN_Ph27]|nr:MazG-like pyrophosphatase [Staphylococcus phage S-CoN_Ph27]
MTNTLDQLVEQVQQWSIDKDLHKGNSDRQALKFMKKLEKWQLHYHVET